MLYALTASQMRRAEEAAVARGEATMGSLMRRAGGALADIVMRSYPDGPVAVVTGKGANGGDGWVAARALAHAGRAVRLLALAPPPAEGLLAEVAREADDAGVPWRVVASPAELAAGFAGCDVIVDAVFGIGLSGAVREPFAGMLAAIEAAEAAVLAADIPSGVQADTGRVDGVAVHADITVTFSAPKPGLLLYPGASYAGRLLVAEVGLPAGFVSPGTLEVWDRGEHRAALPLPRPEDHKGSRGRLLLVAGSRRYAGAAVLAASGAVRMGAGYVRAAVPAGTVPILQAALPQVVCHPLPETPDGALAEPAADEVETLLTDADAVAMGPGLTTGSATVAAVRRLIARCPLPLLVDADALNACRDAAGLRALTSREAPTVITPHPGELGRLLGMSAAQVQEDRLASVRALSGPRLVCLLKGARTLVASGERLCVTLAGNPGMATAGMGDVLTGMIGTLLAQGVEPYHAAALGAYLHARAGDLAAAELTAVCLGSTDIVRFLPAAVRGLLDESHPPETFGGYHQVGYPSER